MSYSAFFVFSAGLATAIKAPKGTKEKIREHVEYVETTLNIKREQYLDNPVHWEHSTYKEISDKLLCEVAEGHSEWVRRLHDDLKKWYETPPADFEVISPEDAKEFFPALTVIDVPSERWTGDYYRARMGAIYEVMRGRPSEGISFDEKPLTIKQASNVIRLFSEFLDSNDLRLDVPKGYDELKSSYDGGYDWCEKCGAVDWHDAQSCRKRNCPTKEKDLAP